ncbi:bifunctional nuclease 1-like isoform X1 [Iris pallida]|uniref:Bifunctional nuclease 1-like isoform X1 n=1 Tax=Iris pallida TaxID=29817 RepID=A0AAX6HYF1_IRIPA|nr:bifunctional nuclease 1-like isoform X1 [Iris pallida]
MKSPSFESAQWLKRDGIGTTIYGSKDKTGLSQKRKLESHISATEELRKKAVVISSAAGLGSSDISYVTIVVAIYGISACMVLRVNS